MTFLESLSLDTLDKVYMGISDDMGDLKASVKIDCQEDYDHYSEVWDEMNMVRTNVAVVYAQKLNAAKDQDYSTID